MSKTILSCIFLLIAWGISCDSKDDESQKREEDDDNMAGDWNDCELASTENIEWEKITDLGSPKDLFATHAGSCEATFKWNGSGWNDGHVTITPTTGEGSISITVEIDQQSAKLVTQVPGDDAYGDVQCNSYMSIEALVTVNLLGGELATQKKIELVSFGKDNPSTMAVSIDEAELLLWLNKTKEISMTFDDRVKGEMSLRIMPLGDSCVGEAYLQYVISMEDGTGAATQGLFGSWSDTGCGVGEQPVDLSEVNDEFGSLKEQTEAIWGQNSYAGKWDDGAETVLKMNVNLVTTDVCQSETQIHVPVEIQYGTDDGRLQEHTTEGDLSLSVHSNGSVRTSQVRFSDDRICADAEDTIGYGLSTCAQLESITVQLGLSRGSGGLEGVSDEGLMIYEYDRDSSASPGAADRVRTFEIGF